MRTGRALAGSLVLGALVAAGAAGLSGCGGPRVSFPYPSELGSYGERAGLPKVHLAEVLDLRPADQREGRGKFLGITYPADDAWERPVADAYRAALAKDVTETRLVELVPLPRQADYTLSAEIHAFSCRLERSALAFVLPMAVGMGGGLAFGKTDSDRLKTGAVLGAACLIGVPMPTQNRAECEVRLTLRDRGGEIVWREICLGEIEERVFVSATAREDRKLAEKYLPRAVKRCNACLLGQLRQFLREREPAEAAPAAGGS